MIKDKDGNRVNFIKRDIKNPLTGAILYDYVDQIKGPGNSNVWACPYCICLPYVRSNLTDYITCTVTSQSEPVPQRASTTSLRTGDYIYCNEEIRMDCTDATLKSMYLSRLRFNFYNSDWVMQPILPKTFKFKRNDGIHQGISTVLNNNSSIVEDGSGNVIKMALTPQDYFGSLDFQTPGGDYDRPTFSRSGSSYILSKNFAPTNNNSTYNRIKELYNNGTFELLDNDGNKKTGTVQVSVIQTGSTSFMCEVKLISTTAIPRKVGTASSTRVILIPRANFQSNAIAYMGSPYGIGDSVFGEDWYIDFTRIYTAEADGNWSLEMNLVGDNCRLYSYAIEPVKIEWAEVNTGAQETDIISIPLNQQGIDTSPGTSYQGILHRVYGYEHPSGTEASEEEFNKIWNHLKSNDPSFTLYYNFVFDTEYGLFSQILQLSVPKNKINLYESA